MDEPTEFPETQLSDRAFAINKMISHQAAGVAITVIMLDALERIETRLTAIEHHLAQLTATEHHLAQLTGEDA